MNDSVHGGFFVRSKPDSRTEVFVPIDVGDGLVVRSIEGNRWKTASLTAFFRIPMERDTVTRIGLVPRLASRGTRSLPSLTEIARYLDEHFGAKMRATAMKIGHCQVVSFGVSFPRPDAADAIPDGSSFVKELLRFIWSCAVEPRLEGEAYPPDVFHHEKEEHRRDIEALINSRPEYAMVRLMEVLSQGDPSGLPAWGVLSDLESIGPADTWQAWKDATAVCPVDVYTVGIPRNVLESACTVHTWKFPGGRSYRPELETRRKPPAVPQGTLVTEDRLPGAQTILCVALATGVDAANPRYPVMLMYNGVLGGFPHSKLFREVRERAGLAYFADTTVNSWRGLVIATAGIEDRHRNEVRDLILEQVRQIGSGQVSEEEVYKTRKGLMRRLMSEKDSPASLIRRSLDSIILGGPSTNEQLLSMLSTVTREDIVELGKEVRPVAVYALRAVDSDQSGRDRA